MIRSFLLIFMSFLFPLLLFGQEQVRLKKDTIFKKDPFAFKNEVGLGVHSLHFLPHLTRSRSSSRLHLTLQGSYKRKLEHFTLRVGVGGGKAYIHPGNPSRQNSGWIGQTLLFLNLGSEKAIWRIEGLFEMDIALDLAHMNRWNYKEPSSWVRERYRSRAFGVGLTWGNTFKIRRRSSVSVETGVAYGVKVDEQGDGYRMPKLSGFKGEGSYFPYRNILISYNYHF